MARTLKVFQAQFGFYDSVVAAASQAAALRAWGTHQNLFADGQARVATDEAAIASARAQPEVPLRRAVGSNDPYSLTPSLPQLPKTPGSKSRTAAAAQPKPDGSAKTKSKRSETPNTIRPARSKALPEPKRPSRAKLDAAEAAMQKADADRWREQEDLARKRADLERETEVATQRWHKVRASAEKVLLAEQKAYRKAGGVA